MKPKAQFIRTLSRIAIWSKRASKDGKSKLKNLSFYEKYCKNTGVKIDMKFADDIEHRLDKARSRCLEEANKTIKIVKAMSK